MIEKNGNRYRIRFCGEFYNPTIVQKAIEDFRDFFHATVSGEFVLIEANDENIVYEFCNYVFSMIK